MTSVATLLQRKGNDVWSVSPESSVYDAIATMAEKNVGALLVMDGENLTGIVSERDYARKVILKGRSSHDTPVRDIMSSQRIHLTTPQSTVEECMAAMTEYRIRHLPVVDNGRVIGMISIGDVVRSLLAEKEVEIRHLENYITGSR